MSRARPTQGSTEFPARSLVGRLGSLGRLYAGIPIGLGVVAILLSFAFTHASIAAAFMIGALAAAIFGVLFSVVALLSKSQPGRVWSEPFSIDVFPFLFIFQAFQSLCGMVFSAIWFAFLVEGHPDFWNLYTKLFAMLVFVGFSLTGASGLFFSIRIVYRDDAPDWDRYARHSMTTLAIAFALTCCLLIWLTNGISSPFIPFYVTAYTLLLTRYAIPYPAMTIFVLHALLFAIACGLAQYALPPPVDPVVFKAIEASRYKDIADFTFVVLSMVVPYFGAWISARLVLNIVRPDPLSNGIRDR